VTDHPFKDKTTDRRVITLLLGGLLVLAGGLYGAGYLASGDRVPQGTTVGGVDIGGLRPAAAQTRLEEQLGPRVEEPIVVAADGRRTTIRPADAGLAVDFEASVDQAGGGRSWHPGRIWKYFTGGDDHEPVVDVDARELDAAVGEFAARIDQRPVEGGIDFADGAAEMKLPETGQELDREAASEAVVEAFLADGSSEDAVQLPVDDVPPEVSEEEVRAAMDEFANPAMSAPVTLVLGEDEVVVRPEAYGRALSMEAENGELVPRVHKKKLMAAIRPAMKIVALSPQPASVQLVDGQPQVIPGKNGVTFDPDEVVEAFPDLVVKRRARTLEVRSKVDRPKFTTKDAKDLRIKEVVSSFTTYYPHSDYRNVNLGRAAELVNGTVLKPGETFSLNETVGERTAENGFTEGFIISNGVYKEDFGGGVSQVATTLFNAMFFAGLEDVEHKPHSFYIDRYPIGREATVAWGAIDLKFKNTTPYGVLIQSWINPSAAGSSGEMHVRMWSTKRWEIEAGVSDRYNFTEEQTRYITEDECVPHDGYGGFDIDVFRYFREPGSSEVVRKETFHTTYKPSDTVVCGPPPKQERAAADS
jgi:vancomycin resistance protein YoaR